MTKHTPSAPQVQMNGLYWENERLIANTEEELRLLSEHRQQAIRIFRSQEEFLQAILRKAVEQREKLRGSQSVP